MRRLAIVLAMVACSKPAPEQLAPSITTPTRETHDRFPIGAGTNHAAASCNDCHGAFDSFRQFECYSCHQAATIAPLHAGNAEFAPVSSACFGCHPKGEASTSRADHDARFPISGAAKHAAVSCAACHVDPADKKKIDCATCHAATPAAHGAVGGFALTTSACLACHADSQVARVAQHLPFKLSAGAPHFQKSCLACHDATRADKPWAADFAKQADCAACHSEAKDGVVTKHAAVPGFAPDNVSCLLCHADGSKGAGSVDHFRFFPLQAGAKHAGIACSTCHVSPTDRTQVDCVTCHQQPGRTVSIATAHAGKVVGNSWQGTGPSSHGQTCTLCHADSQVDRVASHTPFLIVAPSKHVKACEQCHVSCGNASCTTHSPALRTDKPWGLDYARKSCLPCHTLSVMDAHHQGFSGYTPGDPTGAAMCLSCHPTGRKN